MLNRCLLPAPRLFLQDAKSVTSVPSRKPKLMRFKLPISEQFVKVFLGDNFGVLWIILWWPKRFASFRVFQIFLRLCMLQKVGINVHPYVSPGKTHSIEQALFRFRFLKLAHLLELILSVAENFWSLAFIGCVSRLVDFFIKNRYVGFLDFLDFVLIIFDSLH